MTNCSLSTALKKKKNYCCGYSLELPRQITNACFSVKRFEQQHNKTNNKIYAPSEDSDLPGHPPRLIRVFAVLNG